jgi:hypothetical protein
VSAYAIGAIESAASSGFGGGGRGAAAEHGKNGEKHGADAAPELREAASAGASYSGAGAASGRAGAGRPKRETSCGGKSEGKRRES